MNSCYRRNGKELLRQLEESKFNAGSVENVWLLVKNDVALIMKGLEVLLCQIIHEMHFNEYLPNVLFQYIFVR